MCSLGFRIKLALALPVPILAAKAWARLERLGRELRQRYRDKDHPSYLLGRTNPSLARVLGDPSASSLAPHSQALLELADRALAHVFDLLGSGPVAVRYGMRCHGLARHRFPPGPEVHAEREGAWIEPLVNRPNLAESRRIWSLVGEAYVPIDWQIDLRSGFRWRAQTWYRDIPTQNNPRGADIKSPWELARCQHLPQLALAYSMVRSKDTHAAGALAREFRNQVLDFVALNPPRFGVNWACTMDVAIRAVNWVVAYDLFRAGGAAFDPDFNKVIARSAREHAQHIADNLEWTRSLRGNHYLAGICGLLFVSAYLEPDKVVDSWLAFALQELLEEIQLQFHAEGSNIEASTSYHRLSGEMAVYSLAFALGLPNERVERLCGVERRRFPGGAILRGPPPISAQGGITVPQAVVERIAHMAEFTYDLALPSGATPQFGDNDSGRFLKLPGTFRRLDADKARARYLAPDLSELRSDYLDEETLDHRHFVAAANGLLGRGDFAFSTQGREIDTELVALFSSGRKLNPTGRHFSRATSAGNECELERTQRRIRELPEENRQNYEFPLRVSALVDRRSTSAYPEFGIYIVRSERLYLAIRCGRLSSHSSGAHAHNDQLAIELWVEGRPLVFEVGTWVYTPLPDERNQYRSVSAHFAPRVAGREPSRLDQGTFVLQDSARARCLYFGPNGFAGEHRGFGAPVLRAIALRPDRVLIEDGSLGDPLVRLEPMPTLRVSNKYGCQLA